MVTNLKIALAQLNPLVGDVIGNADKLISVRSNLDDSVDILVAPELYISGYPIDDLVLREDFLDLVDKGLENLAKATKDCKSSIIVGAPRKEKNTIRNSVFVIENGEISTFRDKYELPNSGVFDEQRIFTPGNLSGPVNIKGVRIGIPICEDIWKENVIECLAESGAEIIISINASPFTLSKNNERLSVVISRIRENELPLVYLNRYGGQDELVFDGNSFALNDDGSICLSCKSFEHDISIINFRKDKKWIGKGDIIKSGGTVVKNVTGYDLSKVISGSYGTLCAVTEINLKVTPIPEHEETFLINNIGHIEAIEIFQIDQEFFKINKKKYFLKSFVIVTK